MAAAAYIYYYMPCLVNSSLCKENKIYCVAMTGRRENKRLPQRKYRAYRLTWLRVTHRKLFVSQVKAQRGGRRSVGEERGIKQQYKRTQSCIYHDACNKMKWNMIFILQLNGWTKKWLCHCAPCKKKHKQTMMHTKWFANVNKLFLLLLF